MSMLVNRITHYDITCSSEAQKNFNYQNSDDHIRAKTKHIARTIFEPYMVKKLYQKNEEEYKYTGLPLNRIYIR